MYGPSVSLFSPLSFSPTGPVSVPPTCHVQPQVSRWTIHRSATPVLPFHRSLRSLSPARPTTSHLTLTSDLVDPYLCVRSKARQKVHPVCTGKLEIPGEKRVRRDVTGGTGRSKTVEHVCHSQGVVSVFDLHETPGRGTAPYRRLPDPRGVKGNRPRRRRRSLFLIQSVPM